MTALTNQRAGSQILPGYQLMRVLGRGGFGEVWRADAPGGIPKAIKLVPHAGDPNGPTAREVEGHRRIAHLRHPHLLPIERIEFVGDLLVVVMELADKCLADHYDEHVQATRGPLPRGEVLDLLAGVGEALDLLNLQHSLAHLDVKPENLFMVAGRAKLADFGLVRPFGHVNELAITPAYAAPELFDGQVSASVDQYALAVTFQEMATGKRPFQGTDARTIMVQHMRNGPDVSPLAKPDRDVLRRALSPNPEQRFQSCGELLAALRAAADFKPVAAELKPAPRPTVPREDDRTTVGAVLRTDTVRLAPSQLPDRAERAPGSTVRNEFVAFLPERIFAFKLRGFVDDLKAETVSASLERTVLRLRPPGWLGARRAVFIEIDTCVRNPHTGYRVVSLAAWNADRKLPAEEWRARAALLVRYLKAHLMAVDREPMGNLSSNAVREAVLHGGPKA